MPAVVVKTRMPGFRAWFSRMDEPFADATRPSVVRTTRYEDPAGPAALVSTWRAFATPRRARAFMDEVRRIVRACPSYTVTRSDGTPVPVTAR